MDVFEKVNTSNEGFYADLGELNDIQSKLATLPDLIHYNEVDTLRQHLIKVFDQQAFLIQIGDCAERFTDASQTITHLKYKQFVFFKALIEHAIKTPVIVVGRIAGQYAKPRSHQMEVIGDKKVYAYHGDMINHEHASQPRTPDPLRMLQAYHASNKILAHLANYEEKIFTSHECFLLDYEKPLTRCRENVLYNLSTHLPWLGMRHLDSKSHITYLSKINNPIAIKIGANASIPSILSVIQTLNPKNVIGKLILVSRLGINHVFGMLPKIIAAIQDNHLNVIWMCDPLHGNTQSDVYGKKFRLLEHAMDETMITCDILRQNNLQLGGLHLEVSYKTDILECIESFDELTEHRVYDSAVDPRLNHNQCITYFNKILKNIKSVDQIAIRQ